MNVKPQDFKKKKRSVYFSAKFVFLPVGAKTLQCRPLLAAGSSGKDCSLWKKFADLETTGPMDSGEPEGRGLGGVGMGDD